MWERMGLGTVMAMAYTIDGTVKSWVRRIAFESGLLPYQW